MSNIYRADFVHSRLRKARTFIRISFAMRGRCELADVQRTAIKVSMTAFFDAPRQFDFVFRHGRPVLPSLFLRRIVSPARRSKLYGSYFLFNADAVSGTLDDSTRLCVRSPPFPVYSICPLPFAFVSLFRCLPPFCAGDRKSSSYRARINDGCI